MEWGGAIQWPTFRSRLNFMTPQTPSLQRPAVPDAKLLEVRSVFQPDENATAFLDVDLDGSLNFHKTTLILTDRRLLARSEGQKNWQIWDLQPDSRLQLSDHAGVGMLELVADGRRQAVWRFTLGMQASASRMVAQLERQTAQEQDGRPLQALIGGAVCPVCQAPLEEGADECTRCGREDLAPPSTWTLLKLWRFGRPYRKQLLTGFALTLASTAATLVPPYMTMPLMDEVLIPYQSGKPIDPSLVALYLGGLFGAALLAWALGWAKTYILALVSERIGADLRTTTYQHLLSLSLEYFGGRRTGDLIARIGNETDRINVFLSLHLLD
ncbi:MAG: ABC transporter ATP-binding protein, partial [Limnohabitans sp.]